MIRIGLKCYFGIIGGFKVLMNLVYEYAYVLAG